MKAVLTNNYSFKSMTDAAKYLNLSISNISRVVDNPNRTAGGYKFISSKTLNILTKVACYFVGRYNPGLKKYCKFLNVENITVEDVNIRWKFKDEFDECLKVVLSAAKYEKEKQQKILLKGE